MSIPCTTLNLSLCATQDSCLKTYSWLLCAESRSLLLYCSGEGCNTNNKSLTKFFHGLEEKFYCRVQVEGTYNIGWYSCNELISTFVKDYKMYLIICNSTFRTPTQFCRRHFRQSQGWKPKQTEVFLPD